MKIKTAVSALAMSLILIVTGCSGDSGVTFERGKYDTSAKKYSSETFGISATFDDNWEIYDDSKLATVSGMKSSTDEDFIKALDSNGYVFDFYAVNKDAESGTSINITIDNLKKSGNMLLSEENLAKTAIEQIKTQFEAQGGTMDKAEKTTITFAGKEMHSAEYKVTAGGVTIYEIQVFIKKGGYLCTVTLASLSEEAVKGLASKFAAL